MDTDGSVAAGFEGVREAFIEAHRNVPGGAQLCVYRDGRVVVDLCVGRDGAGNRAYGLDTLGVIMSCTKAVVALCVHRLAERGALDLEAPVARYWPAFAAHGKEGVTAAHLLSHTAGLISFPRGAGKDGADLTAADMLDWTTATGALERAIPLWPPGAATLYHPITYGFLLGELVRRIDGRSVGRIVAEEIAGPLGLDLWIGLPAALSIRVARHVRVAGAPGTDWNALFSRLGLDMTAPLIAGVIDAYSLTDALIDLMNEPAARAAEIPAGNGVASAGALARFYAAAIGAVDGVSLWRPETMARAVAPQTDALAAPGPFAAFRTDSPQRFGLGFELPRKTLPMLSARSFGHPGAGGRLGYGDPATGFAVGYVCNDMLWDGLAPDPRWAWNEALRGVALGGAA